MAIEELAQTSDQADTPTDRCRDTSKVFGILKWQGPPLTLEDMQVAIEEGAVARYKRAVGPQMSADDES